MIYEIGSKEEFNQKVDQSAERMILVFYTNSISTDAKKYVSRIRREATNRGIDIYEINLSEVKLPGTTIDRYTNKKPMVCCVSKTNDIKMRSSNPDRSKVKQLIRSLK